MCGALSAHFRSSGKNDKQKRSSVEMGIVFFFFKSFEGDLGASGSKVFNGLK